MADAYEAMTGDRPYRQGCPEPFALEELDRNAGTQFDPGCVTALRSVLDARNGAAVVLAAAGGPQDQQSRQ